MKTQAIRLIDVFALAPLMVWVGVRSRGVPPWARAALIAFGASTAVYNGYNFLKARK